MRLKFLKDTFCVPVIMEYEIIYIRSFFWESSQNHILSRFMDIRPSVKIICFAPKRNSIEIGDNHSIFNIAPTYILDRFVCIILVQIGCQIWRNRFWYSYSSLSYYNTILQISPSRLQNSLQSKNICEISSLLLLMPSSDLFYNLFHSVISA